MLELFKAWLEGRLESERTVRDYLRYAEKLGLEECGCEYECLFQKALKARNKWEKKTVRLWAKLCWQMRKITLDDLKALRDAAQLPQESVSPPNTINIEIESELEKVSDRLKPVVLMLFYSGLRLSEVYELWKRKPQPKKINEELCYAELNWKRGKKRAYYAFAPCEVFEQLYKVELPSYGSLKDKLRRRGVLSKFFRKYHYQVCRETCPWDICDFYQGRGLTISTLHYLDTLERAKSCYVKMIKSLQEKEEESISSLDALVDEVIDLFAKLLKERLLELGLGHDDNSLLPFVKKDDEFILRIARAIKGTNRK